VMGADYARLHALVRGVSERLIEDRPLFEDLVRVNEMLRSPAAQQELLPPRPPAP